MTALLASLGLLPMALSTGSAPKRQKPLAVVSDRRTGFGDAAGSFLSCRSST